MFTCFLLDFSDFLDILVAVFDESLKTDLVIRTASVGSEQKVIVGQKELALLLALLRIGNVPAVIAAHHFLFQFLIGNVPVDFCHNDSLSFYFNHPDRVDLPVILLKSPR